MELTFETRSAGSWTVVAVNGELDISTSDQLRSALDSALDDGAHLAIDLSNVPFMDSSTLGVLVGCLKRARERDGDVTLIGVQGSPQKVLSLTGLDAVFRVVDSERDLTA